MANSFEATLADFDLNFLQPSTNNAVSRQDKQRQSILNVKKKIVASHALLQKFYLQKDKLEETESLLLASKEECRQACIDYKVTQEKYTELEKDSLHFKDVNQELEKKVTHLDNQVEAMKSHAYQLQLLVKEHESVISALKLEKQLQRNSIKDYEKKLGSLEKEHETYLRDIRWMRDVILGKKKAKHVQDILNKYKDEKSSGDSGDSDNSGESDNSGDEGHFDGSPIGSPINEEEKSFSGKILTGGLYESCLNILKKDKISNDHDSDYGNEVVSEDTGRGSSLALSDMNSPDTDYFAGDINIIIKEPIIQIDVGTSPMRIEENLISSPNIFDDEALLSENNMDDNRAKTPEYFISELPFSTEIVTIKQKQQLVDASTSPIRQATDMVHEATSPINFDEPTEMVEISNLSFCALQEEHLVGSNINKKDNAMSLNTLSCGGEVEISKKCNEKIYLEGNNNQPLYDEINNDSEVEMILSKMRLQHELISPLPSSPKVKSRNIAVSEKQISNNSNVHNSCPDALKIREENKALQANVAFLCKEVMLIKSLLANQNPDSENIKTTSKNPNIFDECSRDTIFIRNYDDHSTHNADITTICEDSNNADDTMSITTEVETDLICLGPTEKSTYTTQSMTNNLNFGDHHLEDSEIAVDNVTIEQVDCHNSELRKENEIEDINDISETIESSNYSSEKGTSDGLRFSRNDLPRNTFNVRSKRRKPTKLDRFKKKVLPKGKIRVLDSPSSRKLRRAPLVPIVKKDIRNKPLEILKNKDAYDRALKVMAELKTKKKTDTKILRKRTIKQSDKTDVRNIARSKKQISILKKHSIHNEGSIKEKTFQNPVVVLPKCDIPNVKNIAVVPANNNVVSEKDTSPEFLLTEQSSKPSPLTQDKTVPKISSDKLLNHENIDLKLKMVDEVVPDKEDLAADYNIPIQNSSIQNGNTSEMFVSLDKCGITASDNVHKEKTSISTRRRKRLDSDSFNVGRKRLLRSSNLEKNISKEKPVEDLRERSRVMDYNDLDLFSSDTKKVVEKENVYSETSIGNLGKDKIMNNEENKEHTDSDTSLSSRDIKRRKRNRLSSNNSENSNRRLLRSSNLLGVQDNTDAEKVTETETPLNRSNNVQMEIERLGNRKSESNIKDSSSNKTIISHHVSEVEKTNPPSTSINNPSNNILCKMITKYGKNVIRTSATKVADKIRNSICEKIDKSLSDIVELPPDKSQTALNELVEEVRKLNKKHFLSGLMKYLQDPARKLELYNKVNTQVAMTKKEQMIVYIIKQLIAPDCNIVDDVLRNIEFALFWLNKSPEFDTIESLSHLYAVICRVFDLKCRLKTFLLDAMYCLNYKAVAVIKQCLTTWAHILPLAHMVHAKSPLVTCIVYLLHFYKCEEDKMNRVRDIRWMLNKKYFYTFNDWNQTKILEMFSNAIKTVKEDPAEMYMLRMAIIIFAKRHGAKWCQRNIVNNLLLPTIECDSTPERVRVFCIKMLGPLLKPYPGDMRVHCEIIVNQLLDMMEAESLPHKVKEAVFTSLVFMSKQNPPRVTAALLRWRPPAVSDDLEALLKAYVQEKPLKTWKHILSKMHC